MSYSYQYSGPVDDELGLIFAIVYGGILLVALLIGLACYLMQAYGVYTIAKRRGLDRPWLAWIPVANGWIVGSISDQYRYLVKGEIKAKRKLLLGFGISNALLAVSVCVAAVIMICRLVISGGMRSDGQIASVVMAPVLSILIISGVLTVTKLVEYVLRQMCMYDLYRSCDPGNAIAYLVLGILFSILEPIFLIVIRKRDDGMPPRRPVPSGFEPQ